MFSDVKFWIQNRKCNIVKDKNIKEKFCMQRLKEKKTSDKYLCFLTKYFKIFVLAEEQINSKFIHRSNENYLMKMHFK